MFNLGIVNKPNTRSNVQCFSSREDDKLVIEDDKLVIEVESNE